MEEVLDHNQEAEQIFRQYGRLLELVAAAQLPGRPEDAEECVQDAVWAFVEGRAPWDPAQGSKQTWLCVLVRSRAKDRRRALAAGVGELCRYFAGIGATADDKAELWVLEEPVTWTEGDWTYEADATLRSGVLELELTMSSRLPADQLPSPVELRLGLSADGEPLHNAVHTITPYSVADAGEGSGYPRYRLEQGYQTTASTRLRCTMAAPPPEDCALHVSGLGVQGGVFSLRLVPAETPPTVQKTWTLPQGDMTIWVAEDGSAISASFDSTEWWGWPFDISFIGASGERYPCHDITGAYELDGTERFEAIKPEGMEEPVDAVCIGGVAVERIQDAGGRADHLYESLDWVIELP